MFKLTRSN